MSQAGCKSEQWLAKLGRVAVGGKAMIMGSVFAMWVAALILIRVTPPVYESTAVYGIGPWLAQASEMQKVERTRAVLSWLRQSYPVGSGKAQGGDVPYLSSLGLYAKDWEWIALAARARSPAESHNFLTGVLDSLLSRHQKMAEQLLLSTNVKAASVEVELQELMRQIQHEESRSERFLAAEPARAVAAMVRRNELSAQYDQKSSELLQIKAQAGKDAKKRSKIIMPPSLPLETVLPNPATLFSVFTIFGLAIGWVGAVAMRWCDGVVGEGR